MFQFIFINEKNKLQYKDMLLAWLRSDFERRGSPEGHFWHNQRTISSAFDDCSALVVLNGQNEIVGYMTWTFYDEGVAEIDIVEVCENYRRRGILKKMLSEFGNKFTDVSVLTGNVLPQAQKIFSKLGWKSIDYCENKKILYKIIRPVLPQLDTLPNGRAIAICSEDFYQVSQNINKYSHLMRYFQIDLDKAQKLRVPIVAELHYEGYVGVYFNNELVAEGKVKHLFHNTRCHSNILVLNRIEPKNKTLFDQKGFFGEDQQPAVTTTVTHTIVTTTADHDLQDKIRVVPRSPAQKSIDDVSKFTKSTNTRGILETLSASEIAITTTSMDIYTSNEDKEKEAITSEAVASRTVTRGEVGSKKRTRRAREEGPDKPADPSEETAYKRVKLN